MTPAIRVTPDLRYERALWRVGHRMVAGVDEVGRGPLAGPVVVAAVVLPPFYAAPWLQTVRDSKRLTAGQRERLACQIKLSAVAVGVGSCDAREIDRIGIAPATRAAGRDAIARLPTPPDFLLLDAFPLRAVETDQTALIHGDSLSASIACASIVAKVTRDALMADLDRRFPGYGFLRNRGYGTAEHLAALRRLGPTPEHRRSFAPLRTWCTP